MSIQDGDTAATTQIAKFVSKVAEIAFKMVISDPPLCLDLISIGQKVRFNQYKYESMDGFVKQDEECFIILPSVHKQVTPPQGSVTTSEFGGGQGTLGEMLIKANVLPLNYEFA